MSLSLGSRRIPVHVLERIILHLLGDVDPRRIGGRFHFVSVLEVSLVVGREQWNNVLNFRLASRRLNGLYQVLYDKKAPVLLRLPLRAMKIIILHLFDGQDPRQNIARLELLPSPQRPDALIYQDIRKSNWRDVLNFRLTARRLNELHQVKFGPRPSLLRLPLEIKMIILDFLSEKPRGMVKIENRSCLSLESYPDRLAPSNLDDAPGGLHELKNLRLVNSELSKVCAERLFDRISVRFSKRGFSTLRQISMHPAICNYVKKLTYMVPPFHLGSEQFEVYLEREERERQRQQVSSRGRWRVGKQALIRCTQNRAKEHSEIRTSGEDLKSLSLALKSLKNLERLRLFRVMDENDQEYFKYLCYNNGQQYMSWRHACEHAMRTLIEAFLASDSPANIFDCRFLDVQPLVSQIQQTEVPYQLEPLTAALGRLKGLLLRLVSDNNNSMNSTVDGLFEFCERLLPFTENLSGLHIAFEKVVSVPLNNVFHDMQWHSIKYIGVHLWSMDGGELVKLLLRLPTLRSVRLRQVYLEEGEHKLRWKEVLKKIKQNLTLDWISLFGIGYGDGGRAPYYVEDESSESEYHLPSDDEENLTSEDDNEGEEHVPQPFFGGDAHDDNDYSDSDGSEESETEGNDIEDDHYNIPDAAMDPPSSPEISGVMTSQPCDCERDIGDDVLFINKSKWQDWERWTVKRCPNHDPGHISTTSET